MGFSSETSNKLKVCPLCGSKEVCIAQGGLKCWAECEQCHAASAPVGDAYKVEGIWNRRNEAEERHLGTLKPCPLCGSAEVALRTTKVPQEGEPQQSWVVCGKCHFCSGISIPQMGGRAHAIASWNRRVK